VLWNETFYEPCYLVGQKPAVFLSLGWIYKIFYFFELSPQPSKTSSLVSTTNGRITGHLEKKFKFVVFSVFQASLPSNNPDFDAKLCGCIKKKDRKFRVICQIIHGKFTSCNVKIRCDSVKSRGRCFPLTFSDGLGNVSAKSF